MTVSALVWSGCTEDEGMRGQARRRKAGGGGGVVVEGHCQNRTLETVVYGWFTS